MDKSYPASYKARKSGAKGEVEAIVSVFNNVDLMGDRVVKGAFLDNLDAWRKSGDLIPMVWSHDWVSPMSHIGGWDPTKAEEVEATDDHPAGLKLRGVVDIGDGNPIADQAFKLMSTRRVREFSFAYNIPDGGQKEADDGANELLRLDIIEAGPTLKGANQDTVLLAAKAMGKAEAVAEAREWKSVTDALSEKLEAHLAEAKDEPKPITSPTPKPEPEKNLGPADPSERQKLDNLTIEINLPVA